MAFDDLFGALGQQYAPDVAQGTVDPQTIADRLSRKYISDIERPRQRTPMPPKPAAPRALTREDVLADFEDAPPKLTREQVLADFDDTPSPAKGEGVSASEVPLPKPRPDVGPAPVTGDDLTSPYLDDAPFRTGGKPGDTVWGSQGGMLSGDEAYKIRSDAIAAAEAGVAAARERLAAAEARQRATDYSPTGARGSSRQVQRLSIQNEVEAARQALKEAENVIGEAGRGPLQTQTSGRQLYETVSKTARDSVASIVDAGRGLIESAPTPVEAQIFAGDKARQAKEAAQPGLKAVTEAASKWAEEPRPDPALADDMLLSKLPAGATSMAMFMAGGVAARTLGIPGALGSGGLGGLMQGGQLFKEAQGAQQNLERRIKATEAQRLDATDLKAQHEKLLFNKYVALYAGMGLGATEAIPIERLFHRLNQASQGKFAAVLAGSTAQSVEEALQEAGQALGSNIVAKVLYDSQRDILKDVGDNAAVGAILGAIMGAGGGAISAARGRSQVEAAIPTPEATPTNPQAAMEQPQPPAAPAEPRPENEGLPPGILPQGGSGGMAVPGADRDRGADTQPAPVRENQTAPENVTLDIPNPPAPTSPSEGEVAGPDPDRAILRAYGYNDEAITDMSAAQRKAEVADAIEAGVDPAAAQSEFGQPAPISGQADKIAGTKAAPAPVETEADIDAAAAQVAEEPSQAQKEAENYRMGHIRWPGLGEISIETRKGGTRTAADGSWSVPNYPAHYGRIKGTKGADGDHVDAFMGGHPNAPDAYVINQNDPATGKFDEHKIMLGFTDQASATAAYDAAFSDGTGPSRRAAVVPVPLAELKTWLGDPRRTRRAFPVPAVKKAPERKPKGNLTLLQYLAWKGGLRPDSDLRAMALPRNVVVPGVGYKSVMRGKGMSRDEMLEAAREGGYLPPLPTDRPDDVGVYRQLLDMLDEENRGRPSFQQGVDGADPAREAERIAEENAAEEERVVSALREAGVPVETVDPVDIALAGRIMREEGLSADDAFERAVMRNARAEEMISDEEIGTIYGQEAVDEIHSEPALQDGAGAQDQGADDQRPVAESQDPAESGELPGAREDEQQAIDGDTEKPAEPAQPADVAETREQVIEKAFGAVEPVVEQTPAGEQTVIPGAEKITEAEQAQREADKPLTPKVEQKEPGGLFGEDSKQTDLLDEIGKKPKETKTEDTEARESGPSDSVDKPWLRPGDVEIEEASGFRVGDTVTADGRTLGPSKIIGLWQRSLVSTAKTPLARIEEIGTGHPLTVNVSSLVKAKPAESTDGIDADVKAAFDDIFAEDAEPSPKKRDRAFPAYTTQQLRDTLADGSRVRGMSPEQVAKMRAELEARESGASKPRVTPQVPPRTKTDLATGAAKKAAAGTKKSIVALGELFGGKAKVSSGITFDAETYAKAKPIFLEAAAEFAGAYRDVAQLARTLVDELKAAGYGMDVLRNMRPYLERFVQDVKDGTIDLKSATLPTEGKADESGTDRAENPQSLDNVPAEEGAGVEGGGLSERGDSGDGEARPGGVREPESEGVSGARGGGSGTEPVRVPQAGAGRGRGRGAGGRTRRDGSRVSGQSSVAGDDARPGGEGVEAPANLPAVNFRITEDVALGKGTEGEKFRDNLAAINVLKTLEKENRRATPDEQRALARYVGWGGLANAFSDRDGNFKDGWEKRGKELAELLTPDEIAAARRSTRNAHYTSETLVRAMWKAAKQLGFKGGIALETSVGTGNFLGLIPNDIAGSTRFVGIEYDSLTARIAKALYPQETILHSALQDVPLPDGEATLNIGNPPFGSESLRFQYKPELTGLSIHNQFFLAGLDALRPDGLQILVVSRYLMDAQDAAARQMLAKKGELLGAIRLPGTAFVENARTEVVTDVVFIRRFSQAEEAALQKQLDEARDRKIKPEDIYPDWVGTTQVADPLGGDPITVNNYFAKRKSMILGSLERSGSMRAQNDVTVNLKDGDLADLLDKAIQKLPIDVLRMGDEAIQNSLDRVKTMGESLEIAISGEEPGHLTIDQSGALIQTAERETPGGSHELTRRKITPESPWSRDLYLNDKGEWYALTPRLDEKGAKVKDGKRNVYDRQTFTEASLPASKRLGEARFARLKEMVKLRDLVKRQLVLESNDAPKKDMEANRKELAAAYKAFVDKHDLLNTPSNAALVADMPDGALVMALEINYRAGLTAARAKARGEKPKPPSADPAPIMSRRVVPKYEPASKADSPQEAILISLSERGRIDMERVAGLLGLTQEQAEEKLQEGDAPLAFFDPETKAWETRDTYLSGRVVKKLNAARNEGLEKNVKALEAVQPEPWTAEQVNVVLGATWVPGETYAQFAQSLAGGQARVRFSKLTNSFDLQIDGADGKKAQEWSVEGAMRFRDILSNMLNSRSLKVMREDSDGKKWVDQEATALVNIKAKEIENAFADWVFADGDRRNKLVGIFNEKFNTRVTRQHDGTHLTLPGKVPDEVIALRRHQKNAVWRGIHERFLLLDHVVGAGKTFTAIARIMERRRMGLSRKPMVVVPNHLVDQWAADVYRLYPGAKVLAAGSNQFDRKNRRRLFAKVATGDWDIVIVPHSSFGFIGISPATETRFLENELRIAEAAIKEAQEQAVEDGLDTGRRKPFNVKEAERLAERIKSRLDALKAGKTDRLLTFEQMGVDDLTVDEAHEFKNLFYSSRLTGVRGMGDKTGSSKAFGLYNKVRVLRESPAGTVTFLTGTPISNSAVEMYTMMRYLAADELADLGLEHFDAWRTQSVSAEARFEPTESGSGLKEVTRLGRSWSNMRSLMELYYSFTDAVPQEDISRWYTEDNNGRPFPIPRVKTGGRKEVVVKPTPAQEDILKQVVEDFNNLPSITDPDERNATRLRLMDRARKLSLDARAVDRSLQSDEKGGKLDRVSDEVARIYKATSADRGTQLVFLDRGVKAAKADNATIKEYDELVAKRDEAMAKGDEEGYRKILDRLDEFNPNEIEELRAAQRGGWNAYDQIKSNLVARGIPAEQIRFVQEANNDAEKKALFDSVNDGTVRVLIGSTPKMGAGTNVQERLVALHHVDVTWKPSDIEQREGRIVRQGNKLLEKYGHDKFEVEILAYVTERTVDAKMWDLNATKLKMINGIRKYDGSFTMEFEDSDSVGMAEIAALASGDPMLLERVKLASEIDKLELLERAHRRKQFGIEDQIDQAKRVIRDYPALIEQYKAAADQFRPAIAAVRAEAAGRSITVAGQPYTSGVAASQAFEAEVLRQRNAAFTAAETEAQDKKGAELTDDERSALANKAYPYKVDIDGETVTSKAAAEEKIGAALGDLDPFSAEIEGQKITRRSRVARVVAEKASEFNANATEQTNERAAIGTLYGYDLELNVKHAGYNVEVALDLKSGQNVLASGARYFPPQKEISAAGAKAVLDDLLNDVNRTADFSESGMRARIASAQEDLPRLQEQQSRPFAQAAELAEKRDRLKAVTAELAARAETAEKRSPAPSAPAAQASIIARENLAWTPAARAQQEGMAAMLQQIARRIAGPQVRVQFTDRIPLSRASEGWGSYRSGEDLTAAGVFVPAENLIILALNDPAYADSNKVETAYHEAFHSLEANLLTAPEMAIMRAEEPRLRSYVQREYGFTDAEIGTIGGVEIRAMAFAAYMTARAQGQQPAGLHIAIRRAFERLVQMLRQIRNGLRGMGFQTTEDIFESAGQGDIGMRGVPQPRTLMDVLRTMEPQVNIAQRPEQERRGVPPAPETIEGRLRARNWRRLGSISRSLGFGRLNPTEMRTRVQDKFIRVKNIQKAQEAVTGEPTPERMDTYLAESLYYGRTGEQIERMEREQIDPLIQEIKKRGLTLEEVNDYLYARHAPERNAKVRQINPDIESPSGMSDEEAAAILDAAASRQADFDEIERRVRAIIQQTNEVRLAGGLVSEEQVEQWNQTYQNYVPLRGFSENIEEDEVSFHTGTGMDIRGQESRRALGRESRAEGPLGYVIMQAQEAIIRAEKDRVGRTMLRYVQANPNPALWTVNTPERKRVISPITGMVVEIADPTWATKPNVFGVKVGGKTHFITFHGKDGKNIARALKNIGTAQLGSIMRFIGGATRLFARMQTAWNPEFWVSNFSRDVGEAFINLGDQKQKGFRRLFLKYLIPAMGGSIKGQMGNFEGRFARAFEEFDKAGGRIRFFGLENPEDINNNVARKLRRLEGGLANGTIAAVDAAGQALEIASGAVENATRLAAYMAAREVGMTQAMAAKVARELTVNFNRKGELGSALSSLYAFANAAMQGTVRMAQAMKNKRVRRGAYALAALGVLLTLWNLGQGDDDDGEALYEKIPRWDRDKNFIIMYPKGWGKKKGDHLKIPLPYGYLPFHVLGTRLTSWFYGKTTKEKAVEALFKSTLDVFDFIGRSENMVAHFAPTLTNPAIELYQNYGWHGRSINPPWKKRGLPDSENYYQSASTFSISTARKMNEWSGGTPYKPGSVDVSPGTIDYVLNFLGGGVGRFVANSIATPWKLYEGEEVPVEKAPIARRFKGAVQPAADAALYDEKRKEAQGKAAPRDLARSAMKRGASGPEVDAALAEGNRNLPAKKIFEVADRQVSRKRDEIQRVRNDAKLNDQQKRVRIEEINAEILAIRNKARADYRALAPQ